MRATTTPRPSLQRALSTLVAMVLALTFAVVAQQSADATTATASAYTINWKASTVSGRSDLGFQWSPDHKSLVYFYNTGDSAKLTGAEVLEQLTAQLAPGRLLDGTDKKKAENSESPFSQGDPESSYYYYGEKTNVLDLVSVDNLYGGTEVAPYGGSDAILGADKGKTEISARNGAGAFTITAPTGNALLDPATLSVQRLYISDQSILFDVGEKSSATTTKPVNVYFMGYTLRPYYTTAGSVTLETELNDKLPKLPTYFFMGGDATNANGTSTQAFGSIDSTKALIDVHPSKEGLKVQDVCLLDGNDVVNLNCRAQNSAGGITTVTNGDGTWGFAGDGRDGPGGSYALQLKVTDSSDTTSTYDQTNAPFIRLQEYTDRVADANPVQKNTGEALDADSFFAKMEIDIRSGYQSKVPEAFQDEFRTKHSDEFTRSIYGYKAATIVPNADIASFPKYGSYDVLVDTTSKYGQVRRNTIKVKFSPVAPSVTAVADPAALTDAEKTKVADAVRTANPALPAEAVITVGADGATTITYPAGFGPADTLNAADTVKKAESASYDLKAPATLVPVQDPSALTEAEKAAVKKAVEDANSDLPDGVKISVADDGAVTVTYADGTTDSLKPEQTVKKADNAAFDPKAPATLVPVQDPKALTEAEKAAVKKAVEDANPDLPAGAVVSVDADGAVTVTYADGTTDTLSSSDTVKEMIVIKPTFDPKGKGADGKPFVIDAASFDPANCTISPYVTVPKDEGVIYTVKTSDGTVLKADGNGHYTYAYGDSVTVTAAAAEGYRFADGTTTEWTYKAPKPAVCLPATSGKLAKTGFDGGIIALSALLLTVGAGGVLLAKRRKSAS